MSELSREFERLWNSHNSAKRHQFRNRMRSKLEARGVPFSKENASKLWDGSLVREERARRKLRPRPRKYTPRPRKRFKRRGRKR